MPWALEAQRILAEDWGVSADVWSVTSWNELRRDGLAAEEEAFLNPGQPARVPFVAQQLAGAAGPIVAVTDYMKAVPDQIRQFLPHQFASLGADGFGFSDTRAAARRFFKNDTHSIVVKTLQLLASRGRGRRRRRPPTRWTATSSWTSMPEPPAARAATPDAIECAVDGSVPPRDCRQLPSGCIGWDHG